MDLFTILKFIHILSAIVAVGANLTYLYWIRRAGTDQARLLDALDGVQRLDSRVANPAYIVLLLTGLLMVFNVGIPLTTLWIAAALVLYVLVAFVGIVLYAPALRRQRAEAERDPTSAAYISAATRANLLGAFTVVAVLVIVFLMVFKPTLGA
jgi:uncharacterized membrane protein